MSYITISVVYSNYLIHDECRISQIAIEHFGCLGVEEYSFDEPAVDALLGERSYSGGDLDDSIYSEVEISAGLRVDPIVNFYFEDSQTSEKFKSWLQSLDLKMDIAQAEQETQDWNAYWREHYDTIELVDNYKIVPSWKKENSNSIERDIYIYPGMGFGTGNHETTYLCLLSMFEKKLEFESILDFGCGSGILGIGALKLNPKASVDFYDIDDEALKNCQENIKLNELDPSIYPCLLPDQRAKIDNQTYDLVFANILKHVLIAEKKALYNYLNPSASLLLSGILKEQSQEVIDEFEELGLKLEKEYNKGDWVALLLRRS